MMSYLHQNSLRAASFLAALLITVSALAQTPAPTSTNLEQSKKELNEAARAYREGNFSEAQQHSERALQLDPQSQVAPFFIARTIHAQYKPGDRTPENEAKAHEALVAYQNILLRFPNDEEAYKAIAYLYGTLKEEELLRDWLLKRAADVSIAPEKRSEAYVVLASKDWDCSFKFTELPNNKSTTFDGQNTVVSYRKPRDGSAFAEAQRCATRGLQMSEIAIALQPENESAWSYKTNILLELSKLAEMSGDVPEKTDRHKQYLEALAETTRLSDAARERERKGTPLRVP
jgi:tetratricopeptide (TPR) repeat protein